MCCFYDFSLHKSFVDSITARGITQPTAIQQKVIPLLLNGESLFFESATGSGKTLAFLLPLITLHRELCIKKLNPCILIVTPTIELASQITEELRSLQDNTDTPIKSLLCVGGSSLKRQLTALKEKPAVIIGTPVRIADMVSLKKLKLDSVQSIVIDEADRLLAKEHRDGLDFLLSAVPSAAQVIACSATFNDSSRVLLKKKLHGCNNNISQPQFIAISSHDVLCNNIEHWAFFSPASRKSDTLRSLINVLNGAKILIFTSPANQVETIVQKLQYKKIPAFPLYGKLKSAERKKILARFKSGKIRILITSDLAARGLDIPCIDYIIQLNVLSDIDMFIHRAGRTGRAGEKGCNIVIGDEYELQRLQGIEHRLNLTIYPKILYAGKIQTP